MKSPLQMGVEKKQEELRLEFPNKITYQGKYLKWRREEEVVCPPCPTKRGSIMNFSKASRLRMLAYSATLDWEKLTPALFITLTYPDESDVRENYKLTYQRSWFWRNLERYMQHSMCGIWRVEWKIRKSGFNLGIQMPHIHVLIFRERYIAMDELNAIWKNILKVPYVRTDIEAADGPAGAASYIGKYCSKVEDCSLVNAAYLNTAPCGRAWGVFRKKLIPQRPKHTISLRAEQSVMALYEAGLAGRKKLNEYQNGSYTLLGEVAQIIGEMIFGPDVDEYGEIC